jgi:hypothetical protein
MIVLNSVQDGDIYHKAGISTSRLARQQGAFWMIRTSTVKPTDFAIILRSPSAIGLRQVFVTFLWSTILGPSEARS